MYVIHDVEVAVFFADAAGNAAESAWLVGTVEKLEPELKYEKRRIDQHGAAYGRIRHVDEMHVFTLESLWVSRGLPVVEMPRVRRNQTYVMVIRWRDELTGVYTDRTYYGVTLDGQSLAHASEVFYQSIPVTAQRMVEVSGVDPTVAPAPASFGVVRYVSGSETVDLYRYDYTTKVYSVIDAGLLAGRASIVVGGAATQVRFGLDVVLQAGLDGDDEPVLRVDRVTAVGGTYPLGVALPRVEFLVGASRVACVTASGELVVPDFVEVDDRPDWVAAFDFSAGAEWVVTLGQTGARFPNLAEVVF